MIVMADTSLRARLLEFAHTRPLVLPADKPEGPPEELVVLKEEGRAAYRCRFREPTTGSWLSLLCTYTLDRVTGGVHLDAVADEGLLGRLGWSRCEGELDPELARCA